MASAQMEATLASVGEFISDEESRRAVEEKVMDDEGAEEFVHAIEGLPAGKVNEFLPDSPRRGVASPRMGPGTPFSPKSGVGSPFSSPLSPSFAAGARAAVEERRAEPESVDRVMEWITYLKERVSKLQEQNAALHQKLELSNQQRNQSRDRAPALHAVAAPPQLPPPPAVDPEAVAHMQLELAEAREMAASLHVDNSRLQQQTEALAAEAQVLRGERAEMERSNAYHMKRAMLLEKHLRQLLSSTDPTDTLAHLGRLAFEHSHGTPNFGSPLKR